MTLLDIDTPRSIDAAHTIERVAVVIPARNEQDRLAGCLSAIRTAGRRLRTVDPAVVSSVTVVLDRCDDGSELAVGAFPEVVAITTEVGNVGKARHLGIQRALEMLGGDPATIWIASSDADSQVPGNWLASHLRLARQGAEMVLGTVTPDRQELPPQTFEAWLERHPQRDGHPYVHGANLGIRGDTYLRVGGFAPVREHEDALLAVSVRRSGGRIVSTAECPVTTSGRIVGRTPGGFAGYLAALIS